MNIPALKELKERLKSLRQKEKSGISSVHPEVIDMFDQTINTIDEVFGAFAKANEEIRSLIAKSPVFVDAIEKLDIKPGDVLIAKLGDPASGWIPGPEHEEHILKLFKEAVLDREIDATCLVYNYAVKFEKLSAPAKRELIKNGHLSSPVHVFNGHHYFWNETWTERHGPYDDEESCAAALREYARSL